MKITEIVQQYIDDLRAAIKEPGRYENKIMHATVVMQEIEKNPYVDPEEVVKERLKTLEKDSNDYKRAWHYDQDVADAKQRGIQTVREILKKIKEAQNGNK